MFRGISLDGWPCRRFDPGRLGSFWVQRGEALSSILSPPGASHPFARLLNTHPPLPLAAHCNCAFIPGHWRFESSPTALSLFYWFQPDPAIKSFALPILPYLPRALPPCFLPAVFPSSRTVLSRPPTVFYSIVDCLVLVSAHRFRLGHRRKPFQQPPAHEARPNLRPTPTPTPNLRQGEPLNEANETRVHNSDLLLSHTYFLAARMPSLLAPLRPTTITPR
jgi:hypothetical protein